MCTAIRILTYKDFATKEELEKFQIENFHHIEIVKLITTKHAVRLVYKRYVTSEEIKK